MVVDKDDSTSMWIMEISLKDIDKISLMKKKLPYCCWGLNIGWNIWGIDGLTIHPPTEFIIDWRYSSPYGYAMDGDEQSLSTVDFQE